MLSFVFILFSLGQTDTTQYTNDNPVQFEFKFQNPKLLVSDQRNVEVFTEALKNNLLTNNSLKEALDGTNIHLQSLIDLQNKIEDRKEVSTMDYLSQKTEMSKSDIQTIFDKYNKTQLTIGIILLILTLSAYIKLVVGERLDWKHYLMECSTLVALLWLIYKVLNSVFLELLNPDYVDLTRIIQLIS